jgi:hypothetical protein
MPGLTCSVEWDLLSDKVSAPPPVGSLGVYEIANGRTVVRNLHVYMSDNGRSAGDTRGRGHVGLGSRGYGCALALARGVPARPEKGRHMLGKRIENGLAVLGLGITLVLGVASCAMQGHGRDWTWSQVDAYEHSPIDSGTQGR